MTCSLFCSCLARKKNKAKERHRKEWTKQTITFNYSDIKSAVSFLMRVLATWHLFLEVHIFLFEFLDFLKYSILLWPSGRCWCHCYFLLHHTAQKHWDLVLGVTKGVSSKKEAQNLSKYVSCLKTFANLRASGLAPLLKPTGKSLSSSFYCQMEYEYVYPKLHISKSHVNTSIYLCNINSLMTQKEIRWEADLTWASWFVNTQWASDASSLS